MTALARTEAETHSPAGADGTRVRPAWPRVSPRYPKRALDLVLALLLIIAAAPLLLVISLLIVLDSGWPVLYRQERVGAGRRRVSGRLAWEERRFRILK